MHDEHENDVPHDFPGKMWSKGSLSKIHYDKNDPKRFIEEAGVDRGGDDIITITREDTGAKIPLDPQNPAATQPLDSILAAYHKASLTDYQDIHEMMFAEIAESYPGSPLPAAAVEVFRYEFDAARAMSMMGDKASEFNDFIYERTESTPDTQEELEGLMWEIAEESIEKFGIKTNYRSSMRPVEDTGSLMSMTVSLYRENSDGSINEEFFDVIVGEESPADPATDIVASLIAGLLSLSITRDYVDLVARSYTTVNEDDLRLVVSGFRQLFIDLANTVRISKNFFS